MERPQQVDHAGSADASQTQSWRPREPGLLRVHEAAKRAPRGRLTALLHHVDEQALHRAFLRLRRSAASGVDGMTVGAYEQGLAERLSDLHSRIHSGRYRPQPIRRTTIPKPDGGERPLGILALEDKIVQGAVAEVLDADIRRFFDTVHHRKLMRSVRKRIRDRRFLVLLWRFIKAGHVDQGLFHAAHDGVPQGGVLSPLLSNIMLNEFDQWLDRRYLGKKARQDRWVWNASIQRQRPIAIREARQWRPGVAYCRYADDFVIVVKGTKAQAQAIREECRQFLEEDLSLTLNMEKTHITHVNDGFVFLGHRIIRKRGPAGTMRPVTSIPRDKLRDFAASLAKELSGNHDENRIDLVDRLNRRLAGWANFYQFTDYTAMTYRKLDGVVFWRLAHWLARKYRTTIKSLMKRSFRRPPEGGAKTWHFFGPNRNGTFCAVALRRLVSSRKGRFRWRVPEANPYLPREVERNTVTSRYRDVALAMGHA